MSGSARFRIRPAFLRIESLEKRENPAPIVPVYNSNPGAFAQLYLDFDGHSQASNWCGTMPAINTTVFSTDADFNNFSASELNVIDQLWKRVAEDYVPFNINVTTVLPSDFNNKHAIRVAIGDQSGGNISWGSIGGVACLGSFYNSSANTVYIVPDGLSNNAKYMAMASSHEAGHSFGLGHQDLPACGGYHPGGTYNGENKGPIMGAPYNATRDLWWKGFEGCGTVDDMAIISNANNGYGYVADDISNSSTLARRLRNNSGTLAGSLTGVIHQTSDTDWFAFTSPGGSATITVTPAALGPNLDTILELYQDVDGTPVLLATADTANNVFNATINFSVPGGKKYIVVKSDGDYGEVGAYSLSGTVPSGGLMPGIDNNADLTSTHALAPLFTGVDNTNYDELPMPKGCGCPACMAAAAGVRSRDEFLALSTMASKRSGAVVLDTSSHRAVATAKQVLTSDVTDSTTETTSNAAVIHRVLTGAAPFNVLANDPLASAL